MKKFILLTLALITLLPGCRTDDEYNNVIQEKARLAQQLSEVTKKLNGFEVGETAIANRIARRKLEIEKEENRLEIAATCDRLWVDICPSVMSSLDFEAYKKAGIQPSFTWRSWAIIMFVIVICVAVICVFYLVGTYAYRISKEPRNSDVIAARATIEEANKILDEVNKKRTLMLGGFLEEKIQLQLELANLRLLNRKVADERLDLEAQVDKLRSQLLSLEFEIAERELELKKLQEEIDKKNNLFGR